ncbi:argininosuccinate synthase [Candidatus Gottesmanbacteria bacterium CG_4_10_14_0_8_um_filter_37_24]|uniref:argininosuccinate synthase n=2 Tax=Candidatus Gottesmaniibacteriota TaxID=1752720 RepID=A0A2M7RQW2_9BACT|nr:MAG: argininosuccinate synthase [Candidatus Gottesmanbacteria bacterium CG1_02_37_22]PIZ02701.1 MAG: argininosuccinate synthase [Candidatus Gottesmanbacteria bacterium CG_4_10_14_0_8_um_filter_37_24]
MKNKKKIILAFSGGLDTSFCVLWLKKQGYDVITLTADTGGFTKSDKENIAKQSILLGSIKHYFIDAKEDLYKKIISYIIKGNILRGDVYPLCAGPERLIIAAKLAETAKKEQANAVAHGSTGAGNDQVRFDVALKVLDPQIKIFSPIRDLSITRECEIEFLQKNNISIPKISKSYSINKGMLGVTVGGKETKGSWESPQDDVYPGVTPIPETPNKSVDLILSFQNGLPMAINGKKIGGVEIMEYLAEIGGKHGIGKNIHLGNTIIGIKGRVAFAAPAITVLIKAHKELEKLVQTRWQLFWKDHLADVYGNFLHEAIYFDPVMRDIEAMIDSSQKRVIGDVKIKLLKGNVIIEGYKSPYSLMNPAVAVYGEENSLWTGAEAAGFCKLYGLQSILASNAKKIGDTYEKNHN